MNTTSTVPYATIVRSTLTEHGLRGLFAGSLAGLYRNVPHSQLTYTLYPHLEAFVLRAQRTVDPTRPPGSATFATRFWAGYAPRQRDITP